MILYRNGSIITMNDELPVANYLAVDHGCVVDIGPGEAPSLYDSAEQVDLNGKAVIPGFWETHLHIIDGMRSLAELNMTGLTSFKQLEAELTNYISRLSAEDWVIGHGWEEERLFNGKFPDRYVLDSLCPDRPMVLMRRDGHSVCLNTLALHELGLAKQDDSPEIPIGDDGLPTGMFFENAASKIAASVSKSLTESYLERLVLEAQALFLKNGICSVNDICTDEPKILDLYRRLDNEGKLKIRISAAPNGLDDESIRYFAESSRFATDKLRIGFPKFFMDGSFGSKTAFLSEDYAGDPGNKGLKLIQDSEMDELIGRHNSTGRPVTIHAIGDSAVSCVLDSLERTGGKTGNNLRNRIEHIQIIKEQDIVRFKKLGATASFQPVFLYEEEMTRSRLGEKRLDSTYRFKSFIDSGTNVVFNSDWPYGGGVFPVKRDGTSYIGFEPLLAIYTAAVRHVNPKEKVPAFEALKCYTTNAAYANYFENQFGILKKGFKADFVVLSEDITILEPDKIKDVDVIATVIDGEIVYKKIEENP